MSLRSWFLDSGPQVPGPSIKVPRLCSRIYSLIIAKGDKKSLQSETEIYYKVGKYYKCDMKLLQIVTGITSCYNYYKVRVNKMWVFYVNVNIIVEIHDKTELPKILLSCTCFFLNVNLLHQNIYSHLYFPKLYHNYFLCILVRGTQSNLRQLLSPF